MERWQRVRLTDACVCDDDDGDDDERGGRREGI